MDARAEQITAALMLLFDGISMGEAIDLTVTATGKPLSEQKKLVCPCCYSRNINTDGNLYWHSELDRWESDEPIGGDYWCGGCHQEYRDVLCVPVTWAYGDPIDPDWPAWSTNEQALINFPYDPAKEIPNGSEV